MTPLLHPDPIREIAAPHEFIRIEGAQIRLKGTRLEEAERLAKFKDAARLKLHEGLLISAILILSIYAGLYCWAQALPGAV